MEDRITPKDMEEALTMATDMELAWVIELREFHVRTHLGFFVWNYLNFINERASHEA